MASSHEETVYRAAGPVGCDLVYPSLASYLICLSLLAADPVPRSLDHRIPSACVRLFSTRKYSHQAEGAVGAGSCVPGVRLPAVGDKD